MQLSISTTQFQKSFLQSINDNTTSHFKTIIQVFNNTGILDHSLTTTLFNLIDQEIKVVVDIIRTLSNLEQKLFSEQRIIRKKIIGPATKSNMLLNSDLILEKKFAYDLRQIQNEYKFFLSKFKSSMDKIYNFSGLYEELYIISAFAVSLPATYTLTYSGEIFSISHGSSTSKFTIFPIFFLVKYLFQGLQESSKIKPIMEYLLDNISTSTKYVITLSEDDQIKVFSDYCTMKFISDYIVNRVVEKQSILYPKIINFLRLR